MADDPHITKMKQEVKRAEAQMQKVKDINYHAYNNFVVDKGIQINTEVKKQKDREASEAMREAGYQAAMEIHKTAKYGGSFMFTGLDRILKNKSG